MVKEEGLVVLELEKRSGLCNGYFAVYRLYQSSRHIECTHAIPRNLAAVHIDQTITSKPTTNPITIQPAQCSSGITDHPSPMTHHPSPQPS